VKVSSKTRSTLRSSVGKMKTLYPIAIPVGSIACLEIDTLYMTLSLTNLIMSDTSTEVSMTPEHIVLIRLNSFENHMLKSLYHIYFMNTKPASSMSIAGILTSF